jgi:hydrogenase-4 component F
MQGAPRLDPGVLRLAVGLLVLGYGTKVGLAPMHTWLPDAHSQAPAPVSALMSGVLLSVAFYALLRYKVIADAALGPGYLRGLLLGGALLSLGVAASLLLAQRDYKRMLAYSSIEHMGLACVGLALGPLGVFAALLHLTGHALAKSAAFLISGRVYARYRSGEIGAVSGLLETAPATGVLFATTVFALAGLPPFSLFLSEILIVQAAWRAGHPVVTGLVLVLILLAFASLVTHLQRMLFGEAGRDVPRGERPSVPLGLLALPVALLAWIGVTLPAPLRMLLTYAAEVVRP